jgi:nucleoside-diphosphate-sugar epimerase
MKIIVTGAFGFVGINLLRDLALAGNELVGVDVRPPDAHAAGFLGSAPPVRTVLADLSAAGLDTALEGGGADLVIHAAAVTPLGDFELDQAVAAASVNVAGTARVLSWAKDADVARVVHVSTGSVYGPVAGDAPVDEDTPQRPDGTYGITKSAGEQLARRIASLSGISLCVVRLSHVYGPMERQSPVRAISSPIERWTRAMLAREVIESPREDVLRDFVHISDVTRAIGLLAAGQAEGAFNISSGEQTSEVELVQILREIDPGLRVADEDFPAILSPTRPPLAIDRIAGATGWRPEIGLAAGLRSYVDWRRESGT